MRTPGGADMVPLPILSIQEVQEFAAQRIRNPEDREQLRAVMAASMRKGEPLPEVRLRDRSPEPEQTSGASAGDG